MKMENYDDDFTFHHVMKVSMQVKSTEVLVAFILFIDWFNHMYSITVQY